MPIDKDKVAKILTERGAKKPCHRCGHTNFAVIDGYSNFSLQDNLSSGLVLGGPAVPVAMVACVFPPYIPAPIISDYTEACLIRDLSPKASATLSRRCLQGIIRDYWDIKKDRLIDEINALKDKVDAQTWSAIDAVRKIGNIE